MTTTLDRARLALCVGLLFGGAGQAAQAQQTLDHSFSSGSTFQESGGEEIYHGVCQGCHMPQGQGAVGAGAYPALAHDPRLASKIYPVFKLINGSKDMPSFAEMLDDGQIAAVANYVRTHFGNQYPGWVSVSEVKALRPKSRTASAGPGGAGAGQKDPVVRYKLPNSKFPISLAVEIPANKNIIFLSGMTPPVIDASQPKDSNAAYGDTKTQTIGALKNIETALKGMGLSMKDIVKMQVFMVGDPAKGGKMDFAGMMEGYSQFFGTPDQPNLPSRSAMQVTALANPGFLVEIEVAAVRP